jgi:hypothetical protein
VAGSSGSSLASTGAVHITKSLSGTTDIQYNESTSVLVNIGSVFSGVGSFVRTTDLDSFIREAVDDGNFVDSNKSHNYILLEYATYILPSVN